MIKGTANNYVRFSKSWGGVRKAYEGHEAPWMLQGGFKFPSLDVLPAAGNVLPAFTPVKADELARTIVPMYAFEVISVDSSELTITVKKEEEGTRAKVGMTLIAAPESIGTAAADNITVTAVDSSNDGYDVLTVDKVAVTSGSTSTPLVAEGDVLIESGADKKVKVVPNTLIPYDTCVDEDAFALDGEACWGATSSILERRIPAIPAVIKAALKDAGCVFRFSNRK